MLSPLTAPDPAHADTAAGARIPRVLHDRAIGIVVAAFFAVHRELGHGFTEPIYQRALALELATRRVDVEQDASIGVFYKGTRVGQHRVPFIVERRVVVDLRAGHRLDPLDERLLAQGLRATACEAGLLLLFGPAATFRHIERDGATGASCLPTRRPVGAS
ncbi:MAG: GxxExxY protein [Gemmatimonadaceae bacterium]|nr:GxxExxY protein [Gemmatimonadaceae bacterium]